MLGITSVISVTPTNAYTRTYAPGRFVPSCKSS